MGRQWPRDLFQPQAGEGVGVFIPFKQYSDLSRLRSAAAN
jgi:hypothetical protein